MRVSLLVVCAALMSAAPQAQTPKPPPPPQTPQPQPPPQTPVFRAGVELLTVDATVVDSEGKQVLDLKPGEFIVEVDGKPRPVVSAEYVQMVDTTPIPIGARPKPVPVASPDDEFFSTNTRSIQKGRLILLLVDQGNIRSGSGRPMMRSAAKFVDNLAPADRVALVGIPGPGPLVDFTTDHEKVREGLLATVGMMQPYRGKFNISLSEAIATVDHSDALMTQQLILRECGSVLLSPADAVRCELEVEQECSEIAAQQRHQTDASLRGMREVLKSLANLEGPKSVVLISEGLILDGLGSDVDDIAAIAADVRASLDVMLLDVPSVDAAESRRPTTPREDRDLQTRGLESLAGLSRGGLHRIIASGDQAFARIARSLAGYYLLGVETQPIDRDGRRHRLQVKTSRRGVQVLSRRGFLAPTSPASSTPTDAVTKALQAPLTMNNVPMRMATWTYKEPGGNRVRLLMTAEVERTVNQSPDYTTGLIVIDRNNKVVAHAVDAKQLPASTSDPGVAVFAGSILLDPGSYLVRIAVADSEGRMGSVERKLDAWQMNGAGLTVGDLLIAPASDGKSPVVPAIEPRIANGRLAALIEVYAPNTALLESVQATLDVLPNADAKPIASTPMRVVPGSSPEIGAVQANVSTAALPPGRYLARATVTQGGKPQGHFVRPFHVLPPASPAAAAEPGTFTPTVLPMELTAALLADLPGVDGKALLTPAMMTSVLAVTEKSRPGAATKAVIETARGGKLGPAALAALEAGDLALAAFLRGLDFFAQGLTDRALQQFQVAMQQAPTFAPARMYLGVLLAQTNRHKEAASLLSSVPPEVSGTAPVPRYAAISWLKTGDVGFAIQALEKSGAQSASDTDATRMLALAYVVGNRPADALPLLTTYLAAKPTDQAALLAGVYAVYVKYAGGVKADALAADRAQAQTWAKAYAASGGSLQLVQAWIKYLEGLKP